MMGGSDKTDALAAFKLLFSQKSNPTHSYCPFCHAGSRLVLIVCWQDVKVSNRSFWMWVCKISGYNRASLWVQSVCFYAKMFLAALFPLPQQTQTHTHTHSITLMNHAMSTDSKQVLVITGFVFRLCQSARVCSAYCWLLSGLTLPCRSKHCLVPLRSLGFCSLLVLWLKQLLENFAESPPAKLPAENSMFAQLIIASVYLRRITGCRGESSEHAAKTCTFTRDATWTVTPLWNQHSCVCSNTQRQGFSSLNSSLCRSCWVQFRSDYANCFFCYVSDLMIEADVIHGVLWLQLLECIKTKSFTAFKSLFSYQYEVRWRNSHLSPACSSLGFT